MAKKEKGLEVIAKEIILGTELRPLATNTQSLPLDGKDYSTKAEPLYTKSVDYSKKSLAQTQEEN